MNRGRKPSDFSKKDRYKNKVKSMKQNQSLQEVWDEGVEEAKQELPDDPIMAKIFLAAQRQQEDKTPLQKRNLARIDKILGKKKT